MENSIKDMIAITRQFFMLAREASKNPPIAEILTGLPADVLERIGKMDQEEIDRIATHTHISSISFRLSVSELDKMLSLPCKTRGVYALSLVCNEKRDQQRSLLKPPKQKYG